MSVQATKVSIEKLIDDLKKVFGEKAVTVNDDGVIKVIAKNVHVIFGTVVLSHSQLKISIYKNFTKYIRFSITGNGIIYTTDDKNEFFINAMLFISQANSRFEMTITPLV